MATYIVGLTRDGKWHCFQTDREPRMLHLVSGQSYYDKGASRGAEAFVAGSNNPWQQDKDRYVFACGAHARNRHQAIKLAEQYYNRFLIKS